MLDAHPYDEAFWAGINRAVALLDEYRRVVDSLPDDVEAAYHRSQFHALHALVYAPDVQWGAQGSATAKAAARQTLTTLRLAARALDHVAPTELHQNQGDAIVGLLQEALELTNELPQEIERDHLRQTIGLAIQFAGDLKRFSSDATRAVAAQVISDLQPLADDEQLDAETRSRFKRIVLDLLYQLGVNMAAGYGANGLSAGGEAAAKAIMGS